MYKFSPEKDKETIMWYDLTKHHYVSQSATFGIINLFHAKTIQVETCIVILNLL